MAHHQSVVRTIAGAREHPRQGAGCREDGEVGEAAEKGYAYYAEEDWTHSLCVANSGDDQSSKAGARATLFGTRSKQTEPVGDTSYYSQVHKLNMEAKNTDISSRRAKLRQLTQGSSIKFIFKP